MAEPAPLDFSAAAMDRRRRERLLDGAIGRIPPRFREMTFATWRGDQDAARAREWIEGDRWALLLFGPPGTGKTHLATSVFRELLEREGCEGEWRDASGLLLELQLAFGTDQKAARMIDRLCTVPVLLLDDLGAEQATPWSRSVLSHVLRDRYAHLRRTVADTNLNRRALIEWDPRVADRIWSSESVVIGRGGSSRRGAP